jgi:PleD family two-component response regulator
MNGKLRDGVEKLRKFIKENGGGSDLIEILESLIFKDQLTGLYNKNFFNESLPGELSLAFRDGKPLSL